MRLVALLVPVEPRFSSATITVTPISKIPQYFGRDAEQSCWQVLIFTRFTWRFSRKQRKVSSLSRLSWRRKLDILDPLFNYLDLGQDA